MGLLISCWFIIEAVLIPHGFAKWHRLSFFIHPLMLVLCQVFLLARIVVTRVSLTLVLSLRVISHWILAVFGSLRSWAIGLILIVATLVRTSDHHQDSSEDDEYFEDCRSWADAEAEDLATSIVPCDVPWNEADEAENPCRSIVLSYCHESLPPTLRATVTVQQYYHENRFMEEGCFEHANAEDQKQEAVSYADEDDQQKNGICSFVLPDINYVPLPASEIWSEVLNGDVLPSLQIGGSTERGGPKDSAIESKRPEEQLDDVAVPILRLAGRGGVAEKPDPAAFIDQQRHADEELELELELERELEGCEAASPVWPISWNEVDGAGGAPYALQAPAGTSLAIRRTERYEQHDILYKEYMERMGWFDRLNCERTREACAILNMDIGDPTFLGNIETKIRSLQGSAVRSLMRGIESDLEMVYVAQSCLGWAALHHQYRVVESLASSSTTEGLGFSAGNVTGKFQQFWVLLERYMENECREVKRFWSYSHTRFSAVNLLQVPKVSGFGADVAGETTAANDMLEAMEKAIRVFWAFLDSDNCRPSGKLKRLLWIDVQAEDPRDLELLDKLKKEVHKDKQLRDLRKTRRRWWKKTTPVLESQGIDTLFSLIDVKLVSRVLRMYPISAHQLHWCQDMLYNININKRRVTRSRNGALLFPHS